MMTMKLDDVAKSLAEIENPTEGDSLEAMRCVLGETFKEFILRPTVHRERVAALEKQHEAQSVQLGQLVAQKDKMLALKSAETASIAQLEAHISTLSQEDSQIAASNASIAAEVAAAATNIVETSRSFVSAEPLKGTSYWKKKNPKNLTGKKQHCTALSSLRVAFEEANKQLAEEIERTIDAGSRRPALDGVCADPDGDFANNNAELARLQQVYDGERNYTPNLITPSRYSISQQRFLESAVALAGAEAATEAAKTRKGKEAQWASMDAAALKTRLVEVQEQVAAARANVTTQTSKTIPALCREIAELQATAVLLADCEEKISRQRRYAEKHDIIVAHLQEQEARLELASRAVHREGLHVFFFFFYFVVLLTQHSIAAQRHKQNATLLSAIIKECNTRSHAAESRAQQMQSLSGARLTDDKDAVDPRDTLLQSLYRLLSAEPKLIPPYLSREQLLGAAQELQQSVEQSQTVCNPRSIR